MKVTIIGNVTKDPESKQTNSGKTLANFTVADNNRRTNKTSFWACVAWEGLAEKVILPYVKKGSAVVIFGTAEDQTWEDKDTGKTVHRTVVTVEDFNFAPKGAESAAPAGSYQSDDIPF